jgi:hypothetical protein
VCLVESIADHKEGLFQPLRRLAEDEEKKIIRKEWKIIFK